jgi:hypothetical protein
MNVRIKTLNRSHNNNTNIITLVCDAVVFVLYIVVNKVRKHRSAPLIFDYLLCNIQLDAGYVIAVSVLTTQGVVNCFMVLN